MKRNSRKMLKVAAAALALLLALSLASCGTTLSGDYTSTMGVTLEFKSGSKVVCTQPANLLSLLTKETETFTGTYKIEDDVITFTFEKEGCTVAGEHKIEIGEDYIKLDGAVTYNKTEQGK